jgi:citrate lyase subunit beta/citryl-CoA lyase
VFSPTKEEIDEAKDAIEAYRTAEARGVGAIRRDGKLVDVAHSQ